MNSFTVALCSDWNWVMKKRGETVERVVQKMNRQFHKQEYIQNDSALKVNTVLDWVTVVSPHLTPMTIKAESSPKTLSLNKAKKVICVLTLDFL